VVPVGGEQVRDLAVSFPAIAGGCGALELHGVTFSDPSSADIVAPAEFPVSVPYGQSVALGVRFRPQRAGSWSGSLHVTSSAVNAGDAAATLIGVGLGRTGLPLILRLRPMSSGE
jgi:hypothetical protein